MSLASDGPTSAVSREAAPEPAAETVAVDRGENRNLDLLHPVEKTVADRHAISQVTRRELLLGANDRHVHAGTERSAGAANDENAVLLELLFDRGSRLSQLGLHLLVPAVELVGPVHEDRRDAFVRRADEHMFSISHGSSP
jgi:hypothetical protein